MISSTAKAIIEAPTNALFVCPTPKALAACKALLFHLDRNDMRLTTLGAFCMREEWRSNKKPIIFDDFCYEVATPKQLEAIQNYEQRKNTLNKK